VAGLVGLRRRGAGKQEQALPTKIVDPTAEAAKSRAVVVLPTAFGPVIRTAP
jgi:hypothetical protein